jgi:hypothetical protein
MATELINRHIHFAESADFAILAKWLRAINSEHECKHWLLMLSAQKRGMDGFDQLGPLLSEIDVTVIGGRFPGLIHDGKHHTDGMLLLPLYDVSDVVYVPLDAGPGEISVGVQKLSLADQNSGLILFDPFSEGKSALVDRMYNRFGPDFGCIGGGAGTADLQKEPCIITPDGLSCNQAVIVLRHTPLPVGIAHGWESISEPIKVTKANGSRIHTLNYEPALELYKRIVQNHANDDWESRSFEAWARSYPLGKIRLEAEYIVRDPYAYEHNDLLLVDEVEPGEFIVVLNGNNERLIDGAERARDMLFNQGELSSNDPLFTVDCISRIIYLEDDFKRELQALSSGNPLNGALTIGELVNDGLGPLDIYNKTVALTKL